MVSFKHEADKLKYWDLAPVLLVIAHTMSVWAVEKGLDFKVTETMTTAAVDKAIGRVSSSHRQGRAIDVSVIGWNSNEIVEFVDEFSTLYKDFAAISGSTLKPTLVVFHDIGLGAHFHIQIHPKYKVVK
jgi:hypothetical protein